jgi:2-iminobutanoate/2-iminopropanoate deaminase
MSLFGSRGPNAAHFSSNIPYTIAKISMKKIINTHNAPAPIGPYSQAVAAGNFLFISGQIPLDPHTGELICENVQAETRQVMENIKAVLTEAGLGFDHIVKASIFLTDMQSFALVNQVYGTYFTDQFPARETVQVAGLPKNVNVEISVIAIKP